MNHDERRRVLDLLAQGRITVDEAERLLSAIGAGARPAPTDTTTPPAPEAELKYVRIEVHKTRHGDRADKDVQIKVPIAFVRSGMRIGSLVPGFPGDEVSQRLRERGFDLDFSKMDTSRIDAMLRELSRSDIEVDSGKARVRISCE